jgi:hypothetical protein
MHILIGLALAVALLYGLAVAAALFSSGLLAIGLARVLVFLLLAVCLGAGGAALCNIGPPGPNAGNAAIFGAIVGAILAWPASGIPIYYWRYQLIGTISGRPWRSPGSVDSQAPASRRRWRADARASQRQPNGWYSAIQRHQQRRQHRTTRSTGPRRRSRR